MIVALYDDKEGKGKRVCFWEEARDELRLIDSVLLVVATPISSH